MVAAERCTFIKVINFSKLKYKLQLVQKKYSKFRNVTFENIRQAAL